ncbi:MAG: asparagine synthetase B [Gammaproteobacteria bacterium]
MGAGAAGRDAPAVLQAMGASASGARCIAGQGHALAGPEGRVHAEGDGRFACAVLGHPRWSDPVRMENARRLGVAAVVAAEYRARGRDCLHEVLGDFLIVLVDGESLFVATDRFATRQCYYAQHPGGVVFGTRLAGLRAGPVPVTAIDPQAIYDYVYFHCIPSPRTIFAGVAKMRPAERLEYAAGRLDVQTWWLPDLRAQEVVDSGALKQRLLDTLESAVRECVDGEEIGAFLSGGLDSSTVAGMLARVRDPARTFTIGFDAPQYDESAFAAIAAQHFHTRHHVRRLVPDDVVEAFPRIVAHMDEPFGNSSVVPTYFCAAEAAAQGVTTLLAGDGGDELFGGNSRYARQQVFEAWYRVPGFARRLGESALLGTPLQGWPLTRKVSRYVEQARVPLPDRLQSYNFLHRFAPERVFTAAFLGRVDQDAPLRAWRERYNEPAAGGSLSRMLYLDWKFTLADNDLVKVTSMCDLAGVEVRYPMLADPVVRLSLVVPDPLKIRRGQLRWFYREAMRGFLAQATLDKRKHGFGLPFGVWIRDTGELRRIAHDAVERLKQRAVLDPVFLDEAVSMHQSDSAAYFGELIWILMVLETWLDGRGL